MTPRPIRVLLYGDVNLNVLDGSAIWAVSIAEALRLGGCDVTVLLKAPVVVDRLTSRLHEVGVDVLDARPAGIGGPLSVGEAARRIAETAELLRVDAVIARGFGICELLAADPRVAPRLWAYVTELPRPLRDGTLPGAHRFRRIAAAAHRLFVQTAQARDYVESFCPESAGKTVLLTPMVPEDGLDLRRTPQLGKLSLVYSGKMAREWMTLEMLDLPALLAERGIDSSLTMIGDKVHCYPDDPQWSERMAEGLQRHRDRPGGGVRVIGGLPRAEAMRETASHLIGLSWRSAALDSSLEISTKALEYCALGVAPVLNDTVMHRELLGPDYPFFVSDLDALLDALTRAAADPALVEAAGARARRAVEPYLMSQSAVRLRAALEQGTGLGSSSAEGNVSALHCARTKVPDAQFHLALSSNVPGPDEVEAAVDLLERLVAKDPRFVLHLPGSAAWREPWERDHPKGPWEVLQRSLSRLMSPQLRAHVVFGVDGSTRVNALRRIGWVVGTRGLHPACTTTAEAMASGSVPVAWATPNGPVVAASEWVVTDVAQAAERILSWTADGTWSSMSRAAQAAAGLASEDTREQWDR